MKPIIFNVTRQWYDLFASGVKREEYREFNEYWRRRLMYKTLIIEPKFKQFSEVIIRCGYPPKGGFPETPDLHFDFVSTEVGYAKEGIGRELVGSKPVFVIKVKDKHPL